jgi:hypothetical protein
MAFAPLKSGILAIPKSGIGIYKYEMVDGVAAKTIGVIIGRAINGTAD